ncbi:hypothetical protein N9Y89_00565 [bacterium]|nr:hypothetical protein [bacterium]
MAFGPLSLWILASIVEQPGRVTKNDLLIHLDVVGDEHYDCAQKVKMLLQRYKELQDIIAILGMEELSSNKKPFLK